jgi:hypothetical protein
VEEQKLSSNFQNAEQPAARQSVDYFIKIAPDLRYGDRHGTLAGDVFAFGGTPALNLLSIAAASPRHRDLTLAEFRNSTRGGRDDPSCAPRRG